MVRNATPADVDRIVEMGQRFIAEGGYAGHIVGDPAKMRELVTGLIENERGLLLVVEADGDACGMAGALIFEHPMSGEQVASEMFWWVDPERRGAGVRLFRAVERWAAAHGATRMMMIAPNDRVAEFYEKVGYDRVETTYMRKLA